MSTSSAPEKSPIFQVGSTRHLAVFIQSLIVLIAVAHLFAAFFPSSTNWGFHSLAFFPAVIKIGIPILMLLTIVPSINRFIIQIAERLIIGFASRGKGVRWTLLVLFILLSALAFWFLREKTYFLGDGYLNLRGIGHIVSINDIPSQFHKGPLPGFLTWKLYRLIADTTATENALLAYQLMSIVFGVLSIGLLFVLSRQLVQGSFERLLLFLFILVSGGSQLFFGYVENYPPLYCSIILFTALAITYLNDCTPLVVPAAAFAVMFTMHFGMVALLPAFAFLFYREICRRQWWSVAGSLAVCAAIILLILMMCGYTIHGFVDEFLRSGYHVRSLFSVTNDRQAYPVFSFDHILELANLHALLAPFAPFILSIVITIRHLTSSEHTHISAFLLMMAFCGLGFTVFANTDLGMSRDWDLLASFGLCIIVAAAYAWHTLVPDAVLRRSLMTAMVIVTALHSLSWIAVNADKGRSLERVLILPDHQLWGKRALTNVFEELAVFYRDQNDFERAAGFYALYLQVDSTNSRIWENLGRIYRMMGDADRQITAYEKAVACGVPSIGVLTNIGMLYSERGRYEGALEMLYRARSMNPRDPSVINTIGTVYMKTGSYGDALPWFRTCLEIDSTYALAYLNAGVSYHRLGDSSNARNFFSRFLELNPASPQADKVRILLQSHQ